MSTDHMAAASSDFDIFNLLDTDDIESALWKNEYRK